jgi:hypothetical protein
LSEGRVIIAVSSSTFCIAYVLPPPISSPFAHISSIIPQWHPTTSVPDEKWTEDLFNGYFNHKPFDKITLDDFKRVMGPVLMGISKDPRQRTFGG